MALHGGVTCWGKSPIDALAGQSTKARRAGSAHGTAGAGTSGTLPAPGLDKAVSGVAGECTGDRLRPPNRSGWPCLDGLAHVQLAGGDRYSRWCDGVPVEPVQKLLTRKNCG